MSDAEIRAARAEEAEAVLHVLCAAFGLSPDAARPLFQQDPFYALSHKRVLTLPEDGLASCLTVVPTELRVGEATVLVGGIAGVATRPDRQRRGYAGALLAASVRDLPSELGYPVLALLPSHAPFYQRLGWATASRQSRWRGAFARADAGAALPVSAASSAAEWDAVRHIHAAATPGRTGACRRDARRWRVIADFTPGREAAVFRDPSGRPAGYVIYERGDALLVREMHALTPDAVRALQAFLGGQAQSGLTAEWDAAPADLAAFGLAPPPPASGVMLRLADLAGALQTVHTALYAPVLEECGQTLSIHARDAVQPRNERPLRLTAQGVSFGPPNGSEWLSADIGALAQCYLGYCCPSELAAQGQLTVSSPRALACADLLFPARAPFFAPLDQF